MTSIIKYSIKDMKRNINSIVYFVFQLAISIFFIFLCFTQLSQHLDFGNHVKRISELNLTTFRVYYESSGLSFNTKINDILSEIFMTDRPYSFIESYRFDEYETTNVVIGIGDFDKVFNIKSNFEKREVNNGVQVFIGNKVKSLAISDTLKFGNIKKSNFIVNGKIPINTTYLNKKRLINLDESILILMPYEVLVDHYPNFYTAELISNMGLKGYSNEDIYEYVRAISENGNLKIVPSNFTTTSLTHYEERMNDIFFYLIFFSCTIIFIIIGILSSLLLLIDNNTREYAIQQLYGATLVNLYWRTVIYIFVIIFPPFVFSMLMVNHISSQVLIEPILLVVLVSTTTMLLSLEPLFKLKKQDITHYLRRDY